MPCEAGSFKILSGPDNCTLCPPLSDSKESSTSISRCLCNVGYTRVEGENGAFTCGACPAGTYKDVAGFHACTKCRAGTYSDAIASVSSEGFCRSCPSGTYSPSGSESVSNCVCNKGYTASDGDGKGCQACLPGTYKSFPGSAVCMQCFDNATSPAASDSLDDCECDEGFLGSLSCTPCPPGSYKDNKGSSACTPCEAGKYNNKEAADDESLCLPCFSNSFSEKGSVLRNNCTCRRGFEYVINISEQGSYACDACAPGVPCQNKNPESMHICVACLCCPVGE